MLIERLDCGWHAAAAGARVARAAPDASVELSGGCSGGGGDGNGGGTKTNRIVDAADCSPRQARNLSTRLSNRADRDEPHKSCSRACLLISIRRLTRARARDRPQATSKAHFRWRARS